MANVKYLALICCVFLKIASASCSVLLILKWHTLDIIWRVVLISLALHACNLGLFFGYYHHCKSNHIVLRAKYKRKLRYLHIWLWLPYVIHMRPMYLLGHWLDAGVIPGYIIERSILWLLTFPPFCSLFNTLLLRLPGALAFFHKGKEGDRSDVSAQPIFRCKRDEKRYHYDVEIRQVFIFTGLVCLLGFFSHNDWLDSAAVVVATWRVFGLITYAPAMVFFQRYGIYTQPLSLVRSLIMLVVNYLEIIFCFSLLYLYTGWIKLSECGNILSHPIDSIYFSVVTITTLGYGDFQPINVWGRLLVSLEVVVGLLFVLLIFADFLQRSSISPRR